MASRFKPLGVTLIYALLAFAWIAGSGLVVWRTVDDAALMSRIELIKGGFFVLVTSAVLLWLLNNLRRSRELEFRLRATEALVSHIEQLPLAVIELDRDLKICRWAGTAPRLFGWAEEEVRGRNLDAWPFVHPDDRNATMRGLTTLASGHASSGFSRVRNLTRNGEVRQCEWYNSVRRDAQGCVESLLSLVLDVTDRLEAIQALEVSEARYRSLFDSSHAVMLVIDPGNGAIVDANPAATRFYGWTRQELTSMRIDAINALPVDAIRAEMQAARAALRNHFNFRHRRADGTQVSVEVYSGRVDVGGRELLFSIIHDVTERGRAQRALAKSEARFRALVEGAPDAIFVQLGGRFAFANRAGCRLLGASTSGKLLSLPVIDQIHPDFREAQLLRIKGLNELRRPQSPMEQTWLRLDGSSVDVEASGVPIRYGEHDGALVFVRDITERKRTERRLEDNARLMDMASMAARIGGWSVDLENGSVEWSNEVCRIHDMPPGTRLSIDEGINFYAPECRERIRESFSGCATHGIPYDEELEIITAQGRRLWVRAIGEAVRDASGRIVRVQGAFQDISQLKQTEHEMQRFARRAQALLEITDLVETLDEAGFLRRALALGAELTNSQAAFLHEVDEHRGVAKLDCSFVADPASAAQGESRWLPDRVELLADVRSHDGPVISNALAGASGEISAEPSDPACWRRMTIPVKERGNVVMLASVAGKATAYDKLDVETLQLLANRIRDLVLGRRSELRLRQLSQAIEQSPESIVITDLAPRIEYVNEAFCTITGYSREELIGCNPRILQSGRTPPENYREMWAALTQGRSWKGEFYNRRKNGSEYIEFGHVAPLRDAGGSITHYIAVKEDITERKRIREELDRYQHHLEELVAQRTEELAAARLQAESANEAKSAFLANMSHEIRTPMNGILGMIEVLGGTPLEPQQQEMIEVIRESGKALVGIIDDILDFSKIEAGRLEVERVPVSVRDLVEGLCDSLVPLAASHGVQLSLFVSPTVPERVLADEVRVRQVLYNIIGNGIKFSRSRPERRGQVSVRVEPCDQDSTKIVFTVIDNGIGMAPETVDRLFTPFSQAEVSTTRRFGGTGLGLTICRRLVDLMGGDIIVTSELERGSTFTVKLPVDVPEEQPRRDLPIVAGLRCTLVESEGYDMRPLAEYLLHAGAEVRRVASLSETCSIDTGNGEPMVIVDYVGYRNEAVMLGDGEGGRGYLHITRGRLPSPVVEGAHVFLDETAQRMKTLLNAVAMAAGRVPPIESVPGREADSATHARQWSYSGDEVKILVAEDDEVNRKVILKQLELLGCSADIAVDGAKALEMWRNNDYSLVLTDLHMPNMDGYALVRSIRCGETGPAGGRAARGRTPILALTANALRDEPERARVAGFDEYLTKPIELQNLRKALARWLPTSAPWRAAETASGPTSEREAAALDLDIPRQLLGQDDDVVKALLRDYLTSAGAEVARIEAGMAEGDAQAIAFAAHKLKSSSRSIGAVPFGDFCARLEAAVESGDPTAMQAMRPELVDHWTVVRRAASNVLDGGFS